MDDKRNDAGLNVLFGVAIIVFLAALFIKWWM
jgi:hypothetical protein